MAVLALVVPAAVTAGLFLHVVPPRSVEPALLSGPPRLPESASLVVRPGRTEGRAELVTPAFPSAPESQVGVRLATYTRPPSATVVLEAHDASGGLLNRCSFPPAGYSDNALVVCPTAHVEAVRTVVVSAENATDPLAVYAALDAGVLRGGGLYATPPPGGRAEELRAAWSRLAVTRPRGFGPVAVGLYLTASLGALGLAAVLVGRVSGPGDASS